tara:strand:+ start:215 stop:1105 length:891 start_codon:yes stop_codon:yes gene_type:complete
VNIIPKTRVQCVNRQRALLAESPVWDIGGQCLYWIDIEGRTFNCFNPVTSDNTSVATTERISAFAIREKGGFVVATENGFKLYNLETNIFSHIIDPEKDKPNNRFNDGRCDRMGRFWAGTMVEHGAILPDAGLYCLDQRFICKKKYSNVILSNGLAWSPDNQTMYLADTRQSIVWAFDFDIDTGNISNQRSFIEFGPRDGVPDGATVDTDGCYWLAMSRASQICRYTSSGKLDSTINLPVTKPTMCAFGGKTLNTLYVTTNSYGFSRTELISQPLAGSLFAIELSAQGIAESKFLG